MSCPVAALAAAVSGVRCAAAVRAVCCAWLGKPKTESYVGPAATLAVAALFGLWWCAWLNKDPDPGNGAGRDEGCVLFDALGRAVEAAWERVSSTPAGLWLLATPPEAAASADVDLPPFTNGVIGSALWGPPRSAPCVSGGGGVFRFLAMEGSGSRSPSFSVSTTFSVPPVSAASETE